MSVPLEELNNFELALVDDPDEQNSKISLARLSQDIAPWTWEVKGLGDNAMEVASFAVKANDLQFSWSFKPDAVCAAALCNSVLKILRKWF